MEPRPLTVAAVLAAALAGTLVATVAVNAALRRYVGIPVVRDAHWLELPEGPAILVDGYETGDGSSGYRWALVDARSGDVLDRADYAKSKLASGLPGAPQVVAAGGPRALVETGEGIRLVDWSLGDPEADPAAVFPQIARPWRILAGSAPGVAVVEGADGARWEVDLAASAAHPTTESVPLGSPYRRCSTDADGPLCDERTSKNAAFPGGDPLVVRTDGGSVVLARLADGKPVWTWDSGAAGDVEVFGGETGGFVVRIGNRLVALAGDGTRVWERRL